MAIIDSVRKLAEKVGADTNGRDIADQLNIINKHLDNTQPGSRDIAEAVSKFADKEDGTATFTTKTITENGTYTASDDGVSGYSSIIVNIENRIHYITYNMNYGVYALLCSANGEYDPGTSGVLDTLSGCVLCDPAVSIEVGNTICSSYTFTPGESFTVTAYGNPVTLSGDTVTPNDGKEYSLSVGSGPDGQPRYTISKHDVDFNYTIA
jgi:hypothetical protein